MVIAVISSRWDGVFPSPVPGSMPRPVLGLPRAAGPVAFAGRTVEDPHDGLPSISEGARG
ncbi:hypothetical protein ABH927_003381 [Planotetraspora sp. GP83]